MTKRAVTVPSATPKQAPKASKNDKVVLTGYEKVVDILYEKKGEIESATGVIETTRKTLDVDVTKFRNHSEAEGAFTKSIFVKGSKVNACYSFKDAYAKIDTSVEGDLKKALGTNYDALFKRHEDITIKPNSMEKLKALAIEHGFTDLIESEEYILPVDDFRKVRFEKRDALSASQNKSLDEVVRQVANKPSLSFK